MKVLSLRQPYASLLVAGIKQWETRGWKPGPRNLKIIQRDGLLIHASATKKDAWLMGVPPFSHYLTRLGQLPYGAIIGKVKIGRIIRTEEWLKEFTPALACNSSRWRDEKVFGDYHPGRWAWEVTEIESFGVTTPAKGKLSLWDYKGGLRELETIYINGTPAFTR